MLVIKRIPAEIEQLLVEKQEKGITLEDRERRRLKSVGLRVGTLNVVMMTGKGRELMTFCREER